MPTFFIPVHPDERKLPRSLLQFDTPSGTISFGNVPLQGMKTLETIAKTLALWKPSIVTPVAPEIEYEI